MRVAAFHSGLGKAQKRELLARFECSEIYNPTTLDALVTTDTLGEGYDFPLVSVVGVLRPYMSLPPFYQFVGRATRRISKEVLGQADRTTLGRFDNMAHIITHEVCTQGWFSLLLASWCQYSLR